LGGSVATADDGLVGEVVELQSFEELDERVAGKIVCFDNPIEQRSLDGYRVASRFRIHGPSRAAAHGAVAVLTRSLGTASLRTLQTGSVTYDPRQPRIPCAALSAEDSMLVHRLIARGDRVQIRLTLRSHLSEDVASANVLAEIRGTARPEEIVLVGAHLDSW